MRRLAAVGITTREACGNVVRNVTAAHLRASAKERHSMSLLTRMPLPSSSWGTQIPRLRRKVKIAFSGCATSPCGLTTFHDIGLIAQIQEVDGALTRGFSYYVGGASARFPHRPNSSKSSCPEHELLPLSQAVCRVFARLGEKIMDPCTDEILGEQGWD